MNVLTYDAVPATQLRYTSGTFRAPHDTPRPAAFAVVLGTPLFTVHAVPRDDVLRLYRIVRAEDVAAGRLERAFASNRARGKAPRGPEVESTLIHRGLSTYASAVQAAGKARQFRNIGDRLAALDLHPGRGMNVAATGERGHHTMWGEPRDLAACVTRIILVDELWDS